MGVPGYLSGVLTLSFALLMLGFAWCASEDFPSVPAILYSVDSDPRAGDWSPSLPALSQEDSTRSFIATKIPILNVTLGIDFASPDDLSLLDLLLYRPLPMRLEIVPVWDSNSTASEMLGRCFTTIYQSEGDRERVRDFLRALDEWTWQFKKPSEWTRVGERAANLACQAFTKDIKAAKSIIESVLDRSRSLRDRGLTSRTVIVDGIRIENATIESLLPIMVNAQSLYFPTAHEEL